jgi:hypothetical protein
MEDIILLLTLLGTHHLSEVTPKTFKSVSLKKHLQLLSRNQTLDAHINTLAPPNALSTFSSFYASLAGMYLYFCTG